MYYEFHEPYYALIKGEHITHEDRAAEITSVKVYEDHVAKLEGITDNLKLRFAKCRYPYEDEALHLFANSMSDKNFVEAKELFKKIPMNSIILLDNALI